MAVDAKEAPARLKPGAPLPIEVGFAGPAALRMLGGAVRGRPLSGGADEGVEGLDAVVIDPHPEDLDRAAIERIARRAKAAGAPVIALATGSEKPAWAGLADVEAGLPQGLADASVSMPPPVDLRAFNPMKGFRDLDAAGFAAVIPADGSAELGPGIERLKALAASEPLLALVGTAGAVTLPPAIQRGTLPRNPEAALRRVRPRLGVIDHPSFHRSEFQRAGWIARLSAAGVPVHTPEVSAPLAGLLGAELVVLLSQVDPHALENLDLRERLSVALRRAAMRRHSATAAWRRIAAAAGIDLPEPPMVSVVLATRREEWLDHSLAQIERQTYQPRELVVALHGDEFSGGVDDRIRSLASSQPVRIVRPDRELVLGEALNVGVEAAEGEYITKMDDDDYYNTDHIWDLVLASEYSGADLVGKGAEFVYLEWIDLTIRRFMGDSESDHPRLAGGALMARADALRAIGGWPARRTGEDTWLVKNMKRSGRTTYRTHGFGYILNRHGRGHTWNTNADYFLVQSQKEWRGLRFDQSGID